MRSPAAMDQRARRMQSSALACTFREPFRCAFVHPPPSISRSPLFWCRFLDAFGARGSPQRDALACASRDPRVPL
jgi:hypothetical protein